MNTLGCGSQSISCASKKTKVCFVLRETHARESIALALAFTGENVCRLDVVKCQLAF